MKKNIYRVCAFVSILIFTAASLSCDIAVIGTSNGTGTAGPEEPQQMTESDAMEFAASMKIGWNLGNSFDAFSKGTASETVWGNPAVTKTLIEAVAAAGFGVVRVPITWLGHFGSSPSYTLDSKWTERISTVLGWIQDAGMKAVINIHHDGADSANWLDIKNAALSTSAEAAVTAQLSAIWTNIAQTFKNYGDFLIFESMNEIHDGKWGWGANRTDGGKQYAVLNRWNQAFVDAVRATGGNNAQRYLVVPGYVTNIDLTVSNFDLPDDTAENRLIVTAHFYDPAPFTLEAKVYYWGKTSSADQLSFSYINSSGTPVTESTSWGQEANVISQLDKLYQSYISNNIPVIIGEYGAGYSGSSYVQYRRYYMEYVTKAAHDRSIIPIYWDNGSAGTGAESFGLFNRSTGAVRHPIILAAMIKAVNETYTLAEIPLP